MSEHPSRPHRHASRLSALLPALLFVLSASAQNMYYEGSVDWTDRDGTRIWLHEGKPLQGPCKIGSMDRELAARYSLANYRDGVRSDTVSYYRASSHTLLFTIIRLGEKKRRIYEYDLSDGSFMREWTEVDGRREGACTEWYVQGKPRCSQEYKAGTLDGVSREWDEAGRLVRERTYRDDRLDSLAKSWHYEDPDCGEIEFTYHRQSDRMVERYSFWRDQRGLIERTVLDWDGDILFSGSKPDCDSTRIDTLCGERLAVEIRDYKEGVLRSLERYDTVYGNAMVPHGVFELYGPDGRIGSRMRYEDGALITSRAYDDEEPREDVATTLLSREEGDRLLATASSDSNT